MNIIEEMRRVLRIEAEALRSVESNLTQDYVDTVRIIADCSGQVVVAGVGKSGIIGQKIAATLRSTGTPATFLHASEALHGDLGVVRSGDVVLALGKSGETAELNELLRVVRKADVTIIAMTASPSSEMAALADVVLDLAVPQEACPLNLAPTSSTTVTLAVGDAIAVSLMKLKNVSEEDFARHHPGGQIGRRILLQVSDLMRQGEENPIISVGESVRELLARVTEFRIGAISVVDAEGILIGLVTDYDVRKALESADDFFSLGIDRIMNPNPDTVPGEMKAIDALGLMQGRGKPIAVLPVVASDHRAIGMIHLHDLISARL